MKNFKRFQALVLTFVIIMSTFGATTAFAAEATPTGDTTAVTAEDASLQNVSAISAASETIHPMSVNERLLTSDIQTITLTSSVAGHTFWTVYGKIHFRCEFTTPGGNIVAVRLRNYTANGRIEKEWQSSNGKIEDTVNIDPSMLYQFEYLVAYGSGTVSFKNWIYSVEEY